MKMLIKDPQRNFKIERLKALGATTFVGTTNPADAKIWMDMLEKCFDVMRCPEDRKVRLATLLLQEGASVWWNSVRSKRLGSEITNWSEFKKAFYEEYYPRYYRDAKRSEFLKLVQGSTTVAEYEKKYIELSKYASDLIEDERDRCRRFEVGLREEIRTSTTAMEWREFRKLVEAALRVERSISEGKSRKEHSSTSSSKQLKDDKEFVSGVAKHGTSISEFYGKSSSQTGSSNTKQVTGSPVSIVGSTSEREESTFNHDWYSQCQNYGKLHRGQCLKGKDISYNCKQSNHMRKEYPLLMQRDNDLQGSFSQLEKSKVQLGRGKYMMQAKPTITCSGGQSKMGASEARSKRQVGTPVRKEKCPL